MRRNGRYADVSAQPGPSWGSGSLQLGVTVGPAAREVSGETVSRNLLPAPALHEISAQVFNVLKRLSGGPVLAQVGAEDEVVGCLTDSILLAGLQLARSELIQRLDNLSVRAGSFWAHWNFPFSWVDRNDGGVTNAY